MTRISLAEWHQSDQQSALIKQAIHEAQQAIETALICARQLDPDADLSDLHQRLHEIDYAITDLAAETHQQAQTMRGQYDLIENLYRQRDEAYQQRDTLLRRLGRHRKPKSS